MIKKNLLICILSIFTLLQASASCIIVDCYTRFPISDVGIYTEVSGKIKGTYSDEKGEFNPDFRYDILHFSHINYESLKLKATEISDTIFMTPKYQSLAEITVSNHSQSWYKSILKKVVKNKKKIYRKNVTPLNYKYAESSLSDSSFYGFTSSGSILIMPLNEEKNFKIAPTSGDIVSFDLNSKGDFTQLGRTVYNEMLQNFNNKFLNGSHFTLNTSYENDDKNLIMINYKSTKDYKRDGFMVIDTLNNVLKEITQNCDTKYNLPTHTNAIFRAYASRLGMKCLKWETIINTKFELLGDSYQMSECSFQISRIDERKYKGILCSYFTNMQSQIIFDDNADKSPSWILLPREPYMGILSKKDRIAMDALQKLPVTRNGK